jgi:hypothetical protein
MRPGFALLVFIAAAGCTSPAPVTEAADPMPGPAPAPAVEEPTRYWGRLSRLRVDDANACVSVDDRQVLCWGYDFKGKGKGLTASATRVAQFVDLGQGDATLVDLDVVHNRVCAAFDDGWLRCRKFQPGAEPSFEELPDGVTAIALPYGDDPIHCRVIEREVECSFEPAVPIEPIEPILDFDLAVASHGCAVIEGGEIRCWRIHRYMEPHTLDHVAGAVGITTSNTSCVWTEAGALWCTEPIPNLPALEQSEEFYRIADAGVRSADIEHRHLCALEHDGEVWCAGINHSAELGVGDSDEHLGRMPVELPGPAHEVAVSTHAGCALLEQGVWCWGSHGAARLVDEQDLPETSRVSLESRAVFVFGDQSCAVTPGEELYCWGEEFTLRNSSRGIVRASQPELALVARTPIDGLTERTLLSGGNLFQGRVIARDVGPEEMEVTRVLGGVAVSVVAHDVYDPRRCTISEKGKLECWEGRQRLSAVHWRTGVTAASLDTWEVCAVSEAKVVCAWFEPEAGDTRGWVAIPGIDDDAVAVAHDKRTTLHTCALTKTRRVLCWPGSEREGVFALDVDDAVDIVGGAFGVCVRNEAGAVRCGPVEPDSHALELVLERGALDLRAGRGHWCARLDEDGDARSEVIACHGDNREGQLGTLPGHVVLRPTAIELPGPQQR